LRQIKTPLGKQGSRNGKYKILNSGFNLKLAIHHLTTDNTDTTDGRVYENKSLFSFTPR
jgi:hypothetical protein